MHIIFPYFYNKQQSIHAGGHVQLNYPVEALKRHKKCQHEQMSTEIKRYGEQSLMNFVH